MSKREAEADEHGDLGDLGESPVAKQPRLDERFKCHYCDYTASKISVARHSRVHGTSGREGKASPLSSVGSMSPSEFNAETYCHDCDIRFQSRDTLAVHKKFYCHLRQQYTREQQHNLLKSVLHNPTYPAQAEAPPLQLPQQRPLILQSLLPEGAAPVSIASAAALGSMSNTLPNGTNIVLVPCFVPSVIVPASSGTGVQPLPPATNLVAGVPNTVPAHNSSQSAAKENSPVCSEEQESPLDLSFRKAKSKFPQPINEEAGRCRTAELSPGVDNSSPQELTEPRCTQVDKSSGDAASLHTTVAASPGYHPQTAPVQGILKKGMSKCIECNIVFFSHENFLVHKQYYCSSQQEKCASNNSSENDTPLVNTAADHKDAQPSEAEENQRSASEKTVDSIYHTSPSTSPGTLAAPKFCATCGIRFMSLDTLQAHQLYYCPARHGQQKQTVRNSDVTVTEPITFDDQYQCGRCNNVYHSLQLYRRHTCMNSEKGWKCYICGAMTETEIQLNEHLKLHKLLNVYECTVCGYRGGTMRGMRMHSKVHDDIEADSNILQIVIPQAPDEGDAAEEVLDGEIEAILSKQRPYRRRVSRKGNWRRPYVCELCAVAFESFMLLSIHLQKHDAQLTTRDHTPDSQTSTSHKEEQAADKSPLTAAEPVSSSNAEAGTESEHHHRCLGVKVEPASDGEIDIRAGSPLINTQTDVQRKTPTDKTNPTGEQLESRDVKLQEEIGCCQDDSPEKLKETSPVETEALCLESDHCVKTEARGDTGSESEYPGDQNVSRKQTNSGQISNHNVIIVSPAWQGTNKHCKNCNITFTYQHSYIAHKKYYCRSQNGEGHSAIPTASPTTAAQT